MPDLNPQSYASLLLNAARNGLSSSGGESLVCHNMDGRAFIGDLLSKGVQLNHVIMNLPQSATDFLSAFIGYRHLYHPPALSTPPPSLPFIHVYAFSTAVESWYTLLYDVANRCAGVMRCAVEELGALRLVGGDGRGMKGAAGQGVHGCCLGHIVRDVSPNKQMVCLSFMLPESVANASVVADDESDRNGIAS
jgi:tRNA (guanine37-N1)-methyltransferase